VEKSKQKMLTILLKIRCHQRSKLKMPIKLAKSMLRMLIILQKKPQKTTCHLASKSNNKPENSNNKQKTSYLIERMSNKHLRRANSNLIRLLVETRTSTNKEIRILEKMNNHLAKVASSQGSKTAARALNDIEDD